MKSWPAAASFAALAPFCLALTACAAAAPVERGVSRTLPANASTPTLAVRVTARTLTALRVNLLVRLVARRDLPVVEVRARSPDHRLQIASGCTFHPLRPPQVIRRRGPPFALPAVPLCSVTISASQAGRYVVQVRVMDSTGRNLVAPIAVVIRFPHAAQ